MDRRTVAIDAECVLCSRFAQLVTRFDRNRVFHFTAGADPGSVVLHEGSRRYTKSAAVLRIAAALPPWIAIPARIASWLPERLRDYVYDFIARHRKRIFGSTTRCDPRLH